MESMVNPDPTFWEGRRVFLTGHTGFKGSWLSIWLQEMGVQVRGYALDPPTDPNLFEEAEVASGMEDIRGDVRDFKTLRSALLQFDPEVVFHLAAQPIVRESYRTPRETYEANVMGTVNILEAVRSSATVRSCVVITTDKVYENREWAWGYRETDRLGGFDPYSNSKAAAELVVSAYRQSFFNRNEYGRSHSKGIATARAGNVIGAGDWAEDRLVPDIIRANSAGTQVTLRNPQSIRPWQHVLEPLSGYLLLAESLAIDSRFGSAWNFGPRDTDCIPVGHLAALIARAFGLGTDHKTVSEGLHEARFLKLDISKATTELGWMPRWDVAKAVEMTVRGYMELAALSGRDSLLETIESYVGE